MEGQQCRPRTLLILDDLISLVTSKLTQLWTQGSHHWNTSCLFITQNLLYNCKEFCNHTILYCLNVEVTVAKPGERVNGQGTCNDQWCWCEWVDCVHAAWGDGRGACVYVCVQCVFDELWCLIALCIQSGLLITRRKCTRSQPIGWILLMMQVRETLSTGVYVYVLTGYRCCCTALLVYSAVTSYL